MAAAKMVAAEAARSKAAEEDGGDFNGDGEVKAAEEEGFPTVVMVRIGGQGRSENSGFQPWLVTGCDALNLQCIGPGGRFGHMRSMIQAEEVAMPEHVTQLRESMEKAEKRMARQLAEVQEGLKILDGLKIPDKLQ